MNEDDFDLYMINPNRHQMIDAMPWNSEAWLITSEAGDALAVKLKKKITYNEE